MFKLMFSVCAVISFLLMSLSVHTVNAQQETSYVGAAKCRECHERIYEGWKTTFHP
jgi:hypothetical protein